MTTTITVGALRRHLAETASLSDAGDAGLLPADLDSDLALVEHHLTTLRDDGRSGAPEISALHGVGSLVAPPVYLLRTSSGVGLYASPQAALDALGDDVRPWRGAPIPGLLLRDALELRSARRRGDEWHDADGGKRAELIAPYDNLVRAAAAVVLAASAPGSASWHLAKQVTS